MSLGLCPHCATDLDKMVAEGKVGHVCSQESPEPAVRLPDFKVFFKKMRPNAKLPAYQTSLASGLDIYAAETKLIWPNTGMLILAGFALELPPHAEGQVRPRSGLAKKGIVAAFGTIDSDYRGEVAVNIFNHSRESFKVEEGERIAQLVIAPVFRIEVVEAEELSETARGENGFGSTGLR